MWWCVSTRYFTGLLVLGADGGERPVRLPVGDRRVEHHQASLHLHHQAVVRAAHHGSRGLPAPGRRHGPRSARCPRSRRRSRQFRDVDVGQRTLEVSLSAGRRGSSFQVAANSGAVSVRGSRPRTGRRVDGIWRAVSRQPAFCRRPSWCRGSGIKPTRGCPLRCLSRCVCRSATSARVIVAALRRQVQRDDHDRRPGPLPARFRARVTLTVEHPGRPCKVNRHEIGSIAPGT